MLGTLAPQSDDPRRARYSDRSLQARPCNHHYMPRSPALTRNFTASPALTARAIALKLFSHRNY